MPFAERRLDEENFLLACIAGHLMSAPALDRLDGDRLIALSERHRISPLVHRALTALQSESGRGHRWTEPFARLHRENVKRTLRQLTALQHAREALTAADVPFVVLKGPAHALLYDDPADRHTNDLDLLLRHEVDARRALDALYGAGFEPEGIDLRDCSDRQLAQAMRFRKDATLLDPVYATPVELHWRPFMHRDDFGSDAERLWRGARLSTEDVPMPTLAPVPQFLYTMAHGHLCAWFRLKWLADSVRQYRVLGKEDRDEMLDELGRSRLRTDYLLLDALLQSLAGLELVQGMETPSVRTRDRVGKLARTVMKRLDEPTPRQVRAMPAIGGRAALFRRKASNALYATRLRPGARSALARLLEFRFIGTSWRLVPLPERLHAIYPALLPLDALTTFRSKVSAGAPNEPLQDDERR